MEMNALLKVYLENDRTVRRFQKKVIMDWVLKDE